MQEPDLPQNLNRYSYTLNNPVNLVDPSGHFWELIVAAVAAIVQSIPYIASAVIIEDAVIVGVGVGGVLQGAAVGIGGVMSQAIQLQKYAELRNQLNNRGPQKQQQVHKTLPDAKDRLVTPVGNDYPDEGSFDIAKLDLSGLGRLKGSLENVKKTKRGKELYRILEERKETYKIKEGAPGEAKYDPRTREIRIDPNFHPDIRTPQGPQPASTERILAHEMGHPATGIGDTGPGRMDNVNINENPVAKELGQPPRTRY